MSLAIEDFIIIYLTCLTRSDQADQTDPLTTWPTDRRPDPLTHSKELKSRICQILIDHWQILDFSSFKTKTKKKKKNAKNKNKLMQKCFFYLVWYLCFLIRNLYKKNKIFSETKRVTIWIQIHQQTKVTIWVSSSYHSKKARPEPLQPLQPLHSLNEFKNAGATQTPNHQNANFINIKIYNDNCRQIKRQKRKQKNYQLNTGNSKNRSCCWNIQCSIYDVFWSIYQTNWCLLQTL